jgi:polysaccharide biosynthesis transport protein
MNEQNASLINFMAVLSRRRWTVAYAIALVALTSVLVSWTQQQLFEAKAEVLLSRQNIANTLTDTADPLSLQQGDRLVATQAQLARTPEVARRVLRAVPVAGLDEQGFLKESKVEPQPDTDLLVFSVRDRNPELVRRLATEYAHQFTLYSRELDTASIVRARKGVAERLARLTAEGQGRSALYGNLVEKEEQLRTMEALQTSNAMVVRDGDTAEQVQPRPGRNLLIGIMIGLISGVALAFLRERLDQRVRSEQEISEPLGLMLLSRIPSPPPRLSSANQLVMLAEPHSHEAEAVRILRTNVDFVRADRGVKTIMVTSALEQEGKSTTAANLAVAFATAGQRVALVDLDLRRPYLDRFFSVDPRLGVTNLLRRDSWRDALGSFQSAAASVSYTPVSSNGSNGHHTGRLFVLPSGPLPPDPGDFVGDPRIEQLLDGLRDTFDVVLVDAPPLLPVADALVLGGRVDAVIVVARSNTLSRPVVSELASRLDRIPATKLGMVLTAAETSPSYYGQVYGYQARPAEHALS